MQLRTLIVLAASIGMLACVSGARAQSAEAKALVDSAKATCTVGEQADGFLAFTKTASDPALKTAVDEINAGRAALYRQVAARNGVSPEAAGAAAFVQVVQARLKPGECYRPAGGAWQQK